MDLNKISFFRPVVGKTLREQLAGKNLAGREVVEYLRSIGGERYAEFTPPAHWEKPFGPSSMQSGDRWGIDLQWIYGFSLTHLDPRSHNTGRRVNGFVWTEKWGFSSHYRHFEGDPLDMVVGREWEEGDWILVIDP